MSRISACASWGCCATAASAAEICFDRPILAAGLGSRGRCWEIATLAAASSSANPKTQVRQRLGGFLSGYFNLNFQSLYEIFWFCLLACLFEQPKLLGEADLVVELLVDAGQLVMRLCQIRIDLQAFLKVLDGFRCLARLYERLAEFVASFWKVRVKADSFSQFRDGIRAVFVALFLGQLSIIIAGQVQTGPTTIGLPTA